MSESFSPARGLAHPHAQTIFASLARQPRVRSLRRERWDTPDDDFVDLDILDARAAAPRLLLLHGLEGSSASGYIRELLRLAGGRGWGAYALNFRGCSGSHNRRARSYSSGDPTDAAWAAERIRRLHPGVPLFAAGFSLGGSVLLNLLALPGADQLVDAAAAVSVPFDLGACADLLDTAAGVGRLYRLRFLGSLKAKGLFKAAAHPGTIDPVRVRAASGIRAFDECVTAPLGGFSGAADYYARSSSGPKVRHIRVPTLLLSAGDDPLAPSGHLPADARANPALTLLLPAQGGHVGFVTGSAVRPAWWAEARVMEYFAARA